MITFTSTGDGVSGSPAGTDSTWLIVGLVVIGLAAAAIATALIMRRRKSA
jgi:hypothetical protein